MTENQFFSPPLTIASIPGGLYFLLFFFSHWTKLANFSQCNKEFVKYLLSIHSRL